MTTSPRSGMACIAPTCCGRRHTFRARPLRDGRNFPPLRTDVPTPPCDRLRVRSGLSLRGRLLRPRGDRPSSRLRPAASAVAPSPARGSPGSGLRNLGSSARAEIDQLRAILNSRVMGLPGPGTRHDPFRSYDVHQKAPSHGAIHLRAGKVAGRGTGRATASCFATCVEKSWRDHATEGDVVFPAFVRACASIPCPLNAGRERLRLCGCIKACRPAPRIIEPSLPSNWLTSTALQSAAR
jgi:hypothetical protein